jgi:elongator complex protein 2
VCHLKGHQDWIRGLDFSKIVEDADSGPSLFLASAAQDRIIRLWKITRRKVLSIEGENQSGPTLKMYIEGPIFKAGGNVWQVSLESLLVGHEDWVYSVCWQPPQADVVGHDDGPSIRQQMCVLSASMDRTMMIWKPDLKSGIWMNVVTVGELGHTALGFYGGVWSPQANAILAHGYGGSLHLWCEIGHEESQWRPQVVPSGHSGPVVDVSWGKNGLFLLSASHDQTTRLFACWKRKEGGDEISGQSWHEIARPQVHGHDLNCLVVVQSPGNHCYVSGADEKVARVFEGPRAFIDSLAACTGVRDDSGFIREDIQIMGANMSALGLSQKPIYSQGIGASKRESEVANLDTMEALPDAVPMVLTEPPLEEHLAHHTLWPESHKLYGHGNELFAMCCDHVGKILATACKAQSASVAEIWLWHIDSWRVAGQLRSHTLTVTQMEFSHNNQFLLSVSRDRHLSIYQRVETGYTSLPWFFVHS